ncbi:MAG TPA: hypothetical protein VNJ28_06700 [Candidatus Limnocylindrales bacterium]|jgi:hypothetical protein|nr:hypothetical protein [Candidatus Limnocylindrales bacterium]
MAGAAGRVEETDSARLPDPPRLARAVREAAVDFYYNSWRLVPANAVWGAGLVGLLLVAGPTLAAVLLAPLLAIPTAGIYRMAARLVRDGHTGFDDFLAGIRRFWFAALASGAAAILLGAAFTTNALLGMGSNDVPGWLFGAAALYADLALALVLVAYWPILVDPLREALPLRRRAALAVLVALARPGQLLALGAVVGAILVGSTILFAALLTVSIAYVGLVTTRYVLPLADRLEGRRTVERID